MIVLETKPEIWSCRLTGEIQVGSFCLHLVLKHVFFSFCNYINCHGTQLCMLKPTGTHWDMSSLNCVKQNYHWNLRIHHESTFPPTQNGWLGKISPRYDKASDKSKMALAFSIYIASLFMQGLWRLFFFFPDRRWSVLVWEFISIYSLSCQTQMSNQYH